MHDYQSRQTRPNVQMNINLTDDDVLLEPRPCLTHTRYLLSVLGQNLCSVASLLYMPVSSPTSNF